MQTILEILNNELINIFKELNFEEKYAFFQYSDRPDLSDFQTNCSMALCKLLKKSPIDIAKIIVEKLNNVEFFEKITIDGPGFINVKIKTEFLLDTINKTINDEKLGYQNNCNNRF